MTSAEIYLYAKRRSFILWLPLMSAAVIGVYLTAPMPNGLSVLLTMISGLIAFGQVVDWLTSERKALDTEAQI
ncbi:hypothetical protein [Glutamicibacter sp. NPDC087344]|uniref:hypothetical protein n=1 Tax=Glutamicibacter sp. NPDC087344 TaxID=3363994 RepID=UPI00381B8B10